MLKLNFYAVSKRWIISFHLIYYRKVKLEYVKIQWSMSQAVLQWSVCQGHIASYMYTIYE